MVMIKLQTGPRVVGAKQTRRAVNDGRSKQVYLAKDADPIVTDPIALLCTQKGLSICWVETMKEMGEACGIAVGAAVAAVVD